MKSTKYTRFCRKLFAKTFEKFNISKKSKNNLLEQADIAMIYQEYYSMVLMNIIIGYVDLFIKTGSEEILIICFISVFSINNSLNFTP